MKITVRQLRKLIREEVESAVGVPASGGVYQVGNWEPEVDEMLVFKTGSKAECEAAAVIMSELLKTQVITPEQLDEEDALFEYSNASCVFLKDQPPAPSLMHAFKFNHVKMF